MTDSYIIIKKHNTLTVSPVSIDLSAVNTSKPYGNADPKELAVETKDMVNNETTDKLTWQIERVKGEKCWYL